MYKTWIWSVAELLSLPEALEADVHVAGTPCVDFSPRGKCEGALGKTIQHFYCWIAMRRDFQEKFILQENVKGFETKLIADCLEDIYYIHIVILDPHQCGWPISRCRKFTVLRHKLKTGVMRLPLNLFSRLFHRAHPSYDPCVPLFDMLFNAGRAEILSEFLWSMDRPCSEWTSYVDTDPSLAEVDPLDVSRENAFWRSLTEVEKTFLDGYAARHPNCAYSLNQNPEFGATKSSPDILQTLIKNTGILWYLVI